MTLLVFGFGLAGYTTLFGSGSILGWGHTAYIHPHAGVSADSPGLRLCTASPSAAQRWWYTLENLPATVTIVAVSVATFLILRHAERHGLYAPGVASRIRFLGWFLIADSVLRPVVEIIATRRLWASMADSSAPIQWNVVWTFLFAGLALLSLARIMRVGSGMREELQGVV